MMLVVMNGVDNLSCNSPLKEFKLVPLLNFADPGIFLWIETFLYSNAGKAFETKFGECKY